MAETNGSKILKNLVFTALTLTVIAVSNPAASGEAEVSAAKTVIDGQLRAFLSDDATTAYSFAAPNVKRIFPTVDNFMAMVKQGYKPVHRPREYSFGRSREIGSGAIAQEVLIVGPLGKSWVAIYTLQQQPNGDFQITGVSLKASGGLST